MMINKNSKGNAIYEEFLPPGVPRASNDRDRTHTNSLSLKQTDRKRIERERILFPFPLLFLADDVNINKKI